MKLLLVDTTIRGPTARMLDAGVRSYNDRFIRSRNSMARQELELDILPVNDFEKRKQTLLSQNVIVLFMIERDIHQRRKDDNNFFLELFLNIQTLLADFPQSRVFIISDTTRIFSPLHTLSAYLFGISGVIEERSLISEDVLDELVRYSQENRRYRSMLLIGEPSVSLINLLEIVKEWGDDEFSNSTHDLDCWRACVALAQLERYEPSLGGGDPYSYTKFAQSLNLSSSITSFSLSEDDLRKVISTIARRFLTVNHSKVQVMTLPSQIREVGFPRIPPRILGIADSEIPRRTFLVLRELSISRQGDVFNMSLSIIRLPNQKYRSLSRRKR